MKTTLIKVLAIFMIVSLGTLAEAHKRGHDEDIEPSEGSAHNGGRPGPGFGPRGGKDSDIGRMGGFGANRDMIKGSGGQPGGSMGGKGIMGGMGGIDRMFNMGGMGGFNGRQKGMGPENGIRGGSMSPRKPMGPSDEFTGDRQE